MRRTFKKRRPSDFHSHLRSIAEIGKALFEWVVDQNTRGYKHVVVEPNTYLDPTKPDHHIETGLDLDTYREQTLAAKSSNNHCRFHFLGKLTPRTTPTIVEDLMSTGALGLKMYPDGVTNNSEGGVADFHTPQLHACLRALQAKKGKFQLHPEKPGVFSMRRELAFHDAIRRYSQEFPELAIFVEHVTDRRTLALKDELPGNVFFTITGHHQKLTLDDVLGQAQHFCRPNAKEPEDRDALVAAAISGDPRIISITDSAFHALFRKLLLQCYCAGVFNPYEIAVSWLATLFRRHNALDQLELFSALNGPRAYGLEEPAPDDLVEFVEEDWVVPEFLGTFRNLGQTVVPFLAGDKLPIRVVV